MIEFKIGDTIMVKEDYLEYNTSECGASIGLESQIGKIVNIDDDRFIGIDFERQIDKVFLHNIGLDIETPTGHWLLPEMIELYNGLEVELL